MLTTALTSVLVAASALLVVVPIATLLSAVWLRHRNAALHAGPRRDGYGWGTWLAVVAPGLGGLVWLVSAALHEAEPGRSIACVICVPAAAACHDALLTAALLALVAVANIVRTAMGARFAGQPGPWVAVRRGLWRRLRRWGASSPMAAPGQILRIEEPVGERPRGRVSGHAIRNVHRRLVRRVCAVVQRYPALAPFAGRVAFVRRPASPVAARGWLRPCIHVDAAWAHRVDDDVLAAALLHEAAHIVAADPLRYALAQLSLGLNPAGAWLRTAVERWRARRELACDAWAVRHGAAPLALAEAIVEAARRPQAAPPALAADGVALLRLRVAALLAAADSSGGMYRSDGVSPSALPVFASVAGVAAASAAPHWIGAWPLAAIHSVVEHALLLLGWI